MVRYPDGERKRGRGKKRSPLLGSEISRQIYGRFRVVVSGCNLTHSHTVGIIENGDCGSSAPSYLLLMTFVCSYQIPCPGHCSSVGHYVLR